VEGTKIRSAAKHIVAESEFPSLYLWPCALFMYRKGHVYVDYFRIQDIYTVQTDKGMRRANGAELLVLGRVPTKNGDCGSLYVVSTPIGMKIVGMHSAANQLNTYFVLFSQEMLQSMCLDELRSQSSYSYCLNPENSPGLVWDSLEDKADLGQHFTQKAWQLNPGPSFRFNNNIPKIQSNCQN
jgi:hypothetical protein